MATYYITRSRKDGAVREHEITGVCIEDRYYAKALIYDWIEAGHTFYARNLLHRDAGDALVEQYNHFGQKCIRTQVDNTALNNLLNLPDCTPIET